MVLSYQANSLCLCLGSGHLTNPKRRSVSERVCEMSEPQKHTIMTTDCVSLLFCLLLMLSIVCFVINRIIRYHSP